MHLLGCAGGGGGGGSSGSCYSTNTGYAAAAVPPVSAAASAAAAVPAPADPAAGVGMCTAVIREQQFDGSWLLSRLLLNLLNKSEKDFRSLVQQTLKLPGPPADDATPNILLATAVAVALLEVKFALEQAKTAMIVTKGRHYLKQHENDVQATFHCTSDELVHCISNVVAVVAAA